MDESFPLPGRGAELNWKLLFIPPVSRCRIRFVCNWFKPGGVGGWGGSFVEERLRFSSWWKRWLNLFCLACLSACSLSILVNQIISLPCQHTLLVEQSKLICKRALWFFLLSLFVSFFLFLFSFLLCFFFCPTHISPHLRVCLFAESSSSSFNKKGLFIVTLQVYKLWWDDQSCLKQVMSHTVSEIPSHT